MIVKNESHVIRRCLESVKPLIDSWAIMDTGSTDGTQGIIRECMASIPGVLGECEWHGFADARNKALELANTFHSHFLLILDADETVSGNLSNVPDDLLCGNVLLYGKTDVGRPRTSILRNGLNWKYVGRVHELPLLNGKMPSGQNVEGLTIHTDSTGSRHKDPQWLMNDIRLLADDMLEHPEDRRNCYLMGVMLQSAGLSHMAGKFVDAGQEYERAIA